MLLLPVWVLNRINVSFLSICGPYSYRLLRKAGVTFVQEIRCLECACDGHTNGVLRDVYTLSQGVLYFQNMVRFHGTLLSVILVTSFSKVCSIAPYSLTASLNNASNVSFCVHLRWADTKLTLREPQPSASTEVHYSGTKAGQSLSLNIPEGLSYVFRFCIYQRIHYAQHCDPCSAATCFGHCICPSSESSCESANKVGSQSSSIGRSITEYCSLMCI